MSKKDKKRLQGTIFDCKVCHGTKDPVILYKTENEFICSTCEIEQLKHQLEEKTRLIEIARLHLSTFPDGTPSNIESIMVKSGYYQYKDHEITKWRIEHARLLQSTYEQLKVDTNTILGPMPINEFFKKLFIATGKAIEKMVRDEKTLDAFVRDNINGGQGATETEIKRMKQAIRKANEKTDPILNPTLFEPFPEQDQPSEANMIHYANLRDPESEMFIENCEDRKLHHLYSKNSGNYCIICGREWKDDKE